MVAEPDTDRVVQHRRYVVGDVRSPFESVVGLVRPEPWVRDALCAQTDPEVFFAEPGETEKVAAAKRVCAGCPVRLDCLNFALRNGEKFGVWGGLSPAERQVVDSTVVRESFGSIDEAVVEARSWRRPRSLKESA